MIPSGVTLANTIPIVTNLPVGATPATSASLRKPSPCHHAHRHQTPRYTSQPLALVGGEVRTVLIVDTQLTSDPPVEVFTANDVN